MTAAQHFRSALKGLRLLLAFDVRAWSCFDRTLRGFWASFMGLGSES